MLPAYFSHNYITNKLKYLVATLLVLSLSACGGGGGGSSSGGSTTITGTLLDGAVEGVEYSAASYSGKTDINGHFQCNSGEMVTFSIGELQLGVVACSALVTPIDFVPGASGVDDVAVLNMARLLQSLDVDGNADNGLTIPVAAALELGSNSVDFSLDSAQFEQQPAVQNLLHNVAGLNQLRDACQAELHIKNSLIEADAIPADTALPVCGAVQAAIKVEGGVQQTVAANEVAVNYQTSLLLDNFVLGVDGRAEVYVDGVYETLIDSPTLELALVPGQHQITLQLVDLSGNPVSTASVPTLDVEVADGQAISIALADDVLFLKPYQLFELYLTGVNLADGDTVVAQLAGQSVTLQANNNVLFGVAPDMSAGTQLLELELGGQAVSLQIDALRSDSLDPKADIVTILNDMKGEIAQLLPGLDATVDAARIESLTAIDLALDAELARIPSITADEALQYYLYLDANVVGKSLLPRSVASAYGCTQIWNMSRAAVRFSVLAATVAGLATAATGASAFGGLPGVIVASGAVYVAYQAIEEAEKFKIAFHQSIDCLMADSDLLQPTDSANARSLYRTRATSGVINFQDGVQKSFTVKTTYLSDNAQYADAVRKFSRGLTQLQTVADYLPASWMASLSLPADLNLADREVVSDPASYQVTVTSGDGVTTTVTTAGAELVLEFASTTEQDFSFELVNTQEGIQTSYSVHITVDKPIADDGAVEIVTGSEASGTLTSTDPTASYQVVSPPQLGNVVLDGATGAFTYTKFATTEGPASDSFTFKAVSARGVESDLAMVDIYVHPLRSVTLTVSTSTLTVMAGTPINLRADCYYEDNQAVAGELISWDASPGGALGTGSTMTVNDLPAGTYLFTASVYDEKLMTTKSASMEVVVELPPLSVASVSSGWVLSGGELAITASGGIAPYQYSIDGGVSYSGSSTFTGLDDARYTVSVKDSYGQTASASSSVVLSKAEYMVDTMIGQRWEDQTGYSSTVEYEYAFSGSCGVVVAYGNGVSGTSGVELCFAPIFVADDITGYLVRQISTYNGYTYQFHMGSFSPSMLVLDPLEPNYPDGRTWTTY